MKSPQHFCKTALLITGVLLITSCASIESSNLGHYKFAMTNYGIYTREVASETQNANSPTGKIKTLSSYKFTKKTDQIPLKIGTSFGFEYRIESDGKAKSNDIELLVVRYLPAKMDFVSNSRGSDYIVTPINRQHDKTYLTGFTIENESQLLPGTWRFIMMYHGEVVLKKEFTLVEEKPADSTAADPAADGAADGGTGTTR